MFDSTGAFQAALAVPFFGAMAFDEQGRLLGVVGTPAGNEIHRVDLTTGTRVVLASITSDVLKLSVVPAVPVAADAFIRSGAPNTNEGANERLRIQAAGNNRALVSFDLSGLIRSAITRAMLVMTIADNADNWGRRDVRTVDAHPLLARFTEGNGRRAETSDDVRGSGTGVTWNCGSDANLANQKADCPSQWRGC